MRRRAPFADGADNSAAAVERLNARRSFCRYLTLYLFQRPSKAPITQALPEESLPRLWLPAALLRMMGGGFSSFEID